MSPCAKAPGIAAPNDRPSTANETSRARCVIDLSEWCCAGGKRRAAAAALAKGPRRAGIGSAKGLVPAAERCVAVVARIVQLGHLRLDGRDILALADRDEFGGFTLRTLYGGLPFGFVLVD